MDETLRTLLAALPGTLIGLGTLAWQWRKDRRRAPLEDSDTAVDTSASAAQALKSYSDEVIRLRGELAEMRQGLAKMQHELELKEAQIDAWRFGIKRLVGQLVSQNITPCWQPGDDLLDVKK